VRRFSAIAVAAAGVFAAAGCSGGHHGTASDGSAGGRRAVLYAGIEGPPSTIRRLPHIVGSTEARERIREVRAEWRHELATRARSAPRQHFDNLPVPVLRSRLDSAARTYHFDVAQFGVRSPLPGQVAPRIVVRTTQYLELAHAARFFIRRLDPQRATGDDRTGWRYEGFYFEADDEQGVPFLAVFNFMRGRGPGGGQWARSEPLYPFLHL
jgi:hypothetical protein